MSGQPVIRNELDAWRGLLRRLLGQSCGARHPRMQFMNCDRRAGHDGDHQDRLSFSRFRRLRQLRVKAAACD